MRLEHLLSGARPALWAGPAALETETEGIILIPCHAALDIREKAEIRQNAGPGAVCRLRVGFPHRFNIYDDPTARSRREGV